MKKTDKQKKEKLNKLLEFKKAGELVKQGKMSIQKYHLMWFEIQKNF